jgi:hypothetical protein
LRRKTSSRKDIWHLDEVVISTTGPRHRLWRAVDQDDYILDEIVQTRRNTKASKRLLSSTIHASIGPFCSISGSTKLRTPPEALRPTTALGRRNAGATDAWAILALAPSSLEVARHSCGPSAAFVRASNR